MSCLVRILYDAFPVAGTPSAGTTYLNQVREIAVPNGNFIGEWFTASTGFSPCPSVQQWISRARNPSTGEIVGEVRSTTCHNVVWKGYENTCSPLERGYDCINGACTKKETYNTPGLYASLSDCEVACGSGCSGQCIANSDWTQIEGLANQLKSKNCS